MTLSLVLLLNVAPVLPLGQVRRACFRANFSVNATPGLPYGKILSLALRVSVTHGLLVGLVCFHGIFTLQALLGPGNIHLSVSDEVEFLDHVNVHGL